MTTGFDRRNEHGSEDPTTVRSIAVAVDDVVTALEARQRSDRRTVLRVTPPFAGRMRARLHVVGTVDTDDTAGDPLYVHPEAFVGPDVPSVPSVDETEDTLRSRGDYSIDRHRSFHASAVESWRETVRSALVDRVSLETGDGPHTVEVKYLGGDSG
jgi:hypothetical protein